MPGTRPDQCWVFGMEQPGQGNKSCRRDWKVLYNRSAIFTHLNEIVARCGCGKVKQEEGICPSVQVLVLHAGKGSFSSQWAQEAQPEGQRKIALQLHRQGRQDPGVNLGQVTTAHCSLGSKPHPSCGRGWTLDLSLAHTFPGFQQQNERQKLQAETHKASVVQKESLF